MKYLLFFLLLFFISTAKSQRIIDVDKANSPAAGIFSFVSGEPVLMSRYIKVIEGSPFFSENWMRGMIVLPNGRKYDSLKLRLDILTNEVHYINGDGNQLVATAPISEMWLTDTITQLRYHLINGAVKNAILPESKKAWYQLLTSGPAFLFKEIHKEMYEAAHYVSSTKEQIIETQTTYYLFTNGNLVLIKKMAAIPQLLKDKKEELEKYIKSNHLSDKKDSDYISLITYYNSLLSK